MMPICCLAFLQTLATCSDQSNEDVSQTPRYLYEPTASIAIWLTLRGVQGSKGCFFLDITIYLHLLELYFRKLSLHCKNKVVTLAKYLVTTVA